MQISCLERPCHSFGFHDLVGYVVLIVKAILQLIISQALGRRYSTTPQNPSSNLPLLLLGVGAVSAGAYWYLDRKELAKPKQEKSPLDPQNFIDFKLKKVLPYNHNSSTYSKSSFFFTILFLILKACLSFVFELPNNDASLIPVASFLLVKASNEALLDPKGKPIIRPYTPVSPPDAPGELALLVKRYDQGNMSKYISSLKVLSHISGSFWLTDCIT